MPSGSDELATLFARIRAGTLPSDLESEQLDFKRQPDSKPDAIKMLVEACVCFANSAGGTVVMGIAAVMRTRARITVHGGHEICRLDVARSSVPVRATTSKQAGFFFVRMNNSSREMPDHEQPGYIADHWPSLPRA